MPFSEKFGEKTSLLFDFDNTLLLLNEEEFIKEYFSLAYRQFAQELSIKEFLDHMSFATLAMASDTSGELTNIDRFLNTFTQRTSLNKELVLNRFREFYANEFDLIKSVTKPHPYAKQCLETAFRKGYDVIIATNPMFPQIVADIRLTWADLDVFKDQINFITVGEEFHYTKPNSGYYQEILSKINKKPESCLMIGNDHLNDGAASLIGIDVFLLEEINEIELFTEPKFLSNFTKMILKDKKIDIAYRGSLKSLIESL